MWDIVGFSLLVETGLQGRGGHIWDVITWMYTGKNIPSLVQRELESWKGFSTVPKFSYGCLVRVKFIVDYSIMVVGLFH